MVGSPGRVTQAEPHELGVAGLGQAYLAGRLRPPEVLDRVLDRIAEANPVLSAFTAIDAETARGDAARLDAELQAGRWRGALHGVPVAVKELFDVANLPATYGSQVLAGSVAAADAEIVRRLRRAGAVIVGLTRSHEFGWGITTQHPNGSGTANPWHTDFIPGGSSGGSAAAVAAALVPAAVASDTGGSVRIPAALCGVAGIKPTFGRIPRDGSVALAPSLDTPGFVARTPQDLVPLLAACAGYSPSDPATALPAMTIPGPVPTSLAGHRVGVAPDLFENPLDRPHAAAYQRAQDALADLGARIVELALPGAGEFRAAFTAIQLAEAYHVHHRALRLYPGHGQAYGADVRRRLELAKSVGIGAYLDAVKRRDVLVAKLDQALATVDVLLTPVNGSSPPRRADPDHVTAPDGARRPFRDFIMGFTVPQNLAGVPTVTVCAGFDDLGLPCGVQLTAARGGEHVALGLAAALDQQIGAPLAGHASGGGPVPARVRATS